MIHISIKIFLCLPTSLSSVVGQIQDAMSEASGRAALRPAEQAVISSEDLYSAARSQSNQGLRQLAQKIELSIFLERYRPPSPCNQQLHEVCAAVKYRHIVFSQWDFERQTRAGEGREHSLLRSEWNGQNDGSKHRSQ